MMDMLLDYDVTQFIGGQSDRQSVVDLMDRDLAAAMGKEPDDVEDNEDAHRMIWRGLDDENAFAMSRAAFLHARKEEMEISVWLANDLDSEVLHV